MELSTRISSLPLIGPVYARRLTRLNIATLADLLYHFPHRYEDFSLNSKIARVQAGETVTVRGKILLIKNEYTKRIVIQKAEIEDDTGKISVVWFNQRYLPRVIRVGETLSLSGKIDWFGKKLVLQSPEYEKVGGGTVHTGRLVPVYPETSSISSKWIRSRIAQFLPETEFEEFLPSEIINKYDLFEINSSLEHIHFPKSLELAEKARQRFAFEELFLLRVGVLEKKKEWQTKKLRFRISIPKLEVTKFVSSLPFQLTTAQKRAAREVLSDLVKDAPMNRLLEGDVGSGKTVIAALAAFIVAKNGFQIAVMAPTQILAAQHYQTLSELLTPHGVTVNLITGGTDKKSKVKSQKSKVDVVVGTHALLHQQNLFEKVAFIVIDEQHKFGVEQRAALLSKAARSTGIPHFLTMTATPIPRTVTLTVCGDLDLSILDELPPGRQKIKTWLVPPQKRDGAYKWIKEQIKGGNQAFIVCPLIEESEVETMKTVKAATAEFKRLSDEIFPNLRLGLLHGRMKAREKDEAIGKLRNKKIDILISTPVVEVGIDIPNATIMMVEGAERFGLAQLHQLRGRVGRSDKLSYCLLFTQSPSPKVNVRLLAMQEAKTGPELAELDLRLRGPGEIFGTMQHGFPELKVASFSDLPLIKQTRKAAEEIFPNLSKYPKLVSRLKTHLIMPN